MAPRGHRERLLILDQAGSKSRPRWLQEGILKYLGAQWAPRYLRMPWGQKKTALPGGSILTRFSPRTSFSRRRGPSAASRPRNLERTAARLKTSILWRAALARSAGAAPRRRGGRRRRLCASAHEKMFAWFGGLLVPIPSIERSGAPRWLRCTFPRGSALDSSHRRQFCMGWRGIREAFEYKVDVRRSWRQAKRSPAPRRRR